MQGGAAIGWSVPQKIFWLHARLEQQDLSLAQALITKSCCKGHMRARQEGGLQTYCKGQ